MAATSDLELIIHRKDTDTYSVDFRYTDSDKENQADVRLGQRQQATAQIKVAELKFLVSNPDKYSETLTSAFFADTNLCTAFAQARSAVEKANGTLRVRLTIDPGAADLHPVVWEMLNDPQSGIGLATDQKIYFSRYHSSLDWRPVRLRSRYEMRALAAVAAPAGLENYPDLNLAPIEREKEMATIRKGLGTIPVNEVERASLAGIVAGLTKAEYDILYLVAHGTFRKNEPILWLEDEKGGVAQVSGEEFVEQLQALEHRPRLIVLTSCQSAGAGQGDVLSALGPRLAEAGIAAVLAMQGNLSMETAPILIPAFFAELQNDGRIDRALNVARQQAKLQGRRDWWMPALFMRLKSGQLWYTPGFGGPQGEFEKWPSLLDGINSGKCTPIIGPGLTDVLMGSVRDLAQNWAVELNYPLASHERESLPQVSQFRSIDQSRNTAVSDWMKQMRKAIVKRHNIPQTMRNHSTPVEKMLEVADKPLRENDEYEPHRVLASMPVKVYITANTDELLEAALIEAGRTPKMMVCPWREFRDIEASMYTANDTDKFTADRPLVYHLFGLLSQPESLVLTEDDTFEFLIGITKNNKNIPSQVWRALTDSALLFLGFQTEEWNFRVLMQALLTKQGSELLKYHAHIAAQIEPEEGRSLDPGRARRYLEKYLSQGSDININIFWGNAREFIKELATRMVPETL